VQFSRVRRPWTSTSANDTRHRTMISMSLRRRSALFGKIGPGILVTHSHSAAWLAHRHQEPECRASFLMNRQNCIPASEVLPDASSSAAGGGWRAAVGFHEANEDSCHHLLRIYSGATSTNRARPMAYVWRWRVMEGCGKPPSGDVTVVHLPETGIR